MPKTTPPSPDHDLLIRIDEKVGLLAGDVKEIKTNIVARVEALERNRVKVADFETYQDKVDLRIARLERLVYIGLGLVLAIEFVILIASNIYPNIHL